MGLRIYNIKNHSLKMYTRAYNRKKYQNYVFANMYFNVEFQKQNRHRY